MNFPIIGQLVTDILGELHNSCPNSKCKETLLIHALHSKIAADQYFQAIFEVASASDPKIAEAVDRIKMLVGPAFHTGKTAEVYPFPEAPKVN